MSDPQVRVEGARELRAALRRLGDDLTDFADIHAAVGQVVTNEARGRVRSRSGKLAASGRPSRTKTSAIVRFGGARVPYANAVHWGTGSRRGLRGPHNIAPNRFATAAASDTEPEWTGLYERAVKAKVDQAIQRSRNTP